MFVDIKWRLCHKCEWLCPPNCQLAIPGWFLQINQIVLFCLGAHLFRVDPGLVTLSQNLAANFTCANTSCLVLWKSNNFSAETSVALWVKGKYSLPSLKVAEEWTWKLSWSISNRDRVSFAAVSIPYIDYATPWVLSGCSAALSVASAGTFLWFSHFPLVPTL